jgi:hypothetical protein
MPAIQHLLRKDAATTDIFTATVSDIATTTLGAILGDPVQPLVRSYDTATATESLSAAAATVSGSAASITKNMSTILTPTEQTVTNFAAYMMLQVGYIVFSPS